MALRQRAGPVQEAEVQPARSAASTAFFSAPLARSRAARASAPVALALTTSNWRQFFSDSGNFPINAAESN